MAIQMRRGLKADFDPNKLLPGEWAVSIDASTSNQIVWMCFAPGICKQIGTYEDFKAQIAEATQDIKNDYKAEFDTILKEVQELAESVVVNADEVVVMHTQIKDDYLPQIVNAYNHAVAAQSYATGGTGSRENEDIDNAKYYCEQTKQIAQGINGVSYRGTITFDELPAENIENNSMYNISDAFTSDARFKDGGGVYYGAGNNVIYTADGMWDVTAASSVTGIKGSAESAYRQGNVNITPANIGLGNVNNTTDAEKSVKYATTAGTAANAVRDADGNNIADTYAKKTELSRYVKSDGAVSEMADNGDAIEVYSSNGTHVLYSDQNKPSKSDVGLENVPNVNTNNQTPTFSQASTRANIASGETISVIMGKIAKFFADMKTVAFSGSYNDLSNKPTIPAAVAVKGNAESSYRTGNVNITPTNIGLGNVNNTADSAKSVKYAASAGTTLEMVNSSGNLLDIGSATKPVYFNGGIPEPCDRSLVALTNNLLATKSGTALDAVQGKALDDKIKVVDEAVGIETTVIDGIPNWRERGADTWSPFSGGLDEITFEIHGHVDCAEDSDMPYGYGYMYFPRDVVQTVSVKVLDYRAYVDGYFSINIDGCIGTSTFKNISSASILNDSYIGTEIKATKGQINALSSEYDTIRIRWTLSDDDYMASPVGKCSVTIGLN